MNVAKSFSTSLIFVIILYLFSICLTFLVPSYADAPFSEATPSMFFGWLWYVTFSIVQFITTWGPIVIICVFGTIIDIVLKIISNIWNAIPVLSGFFHFYYPGITFQNSIDVILTINERAYVTILSLGTEFEWVGNAYTGYWLDQGAGLLAGLGYFASDILDIASALIADAQTIAEERALAIIAVAQASALVLITAGQATADAIVGEAEALLTLIEDKIVVIQSDLEGEGHWVTEYPFGIKFTYWVWDHLPDVAAAAVHLGELIVELIAELLKFD